MKKTIVSLICAALTIATSSWSDQDDRSPTHSEKQEKVYISPDHLQFNNHQMHVFHDDNWIQVHAIYSDSNGLFIDRKQASPETWYCNNCRTYHNADQKCPYEQVKKRK